MPPVRRPSDTSIAACHMTQVIEPNISEMTIAVITARSRMRRRAVVNASSTALPKRALSRLSWQNAWTIFIAPSVSDTIAPTSAIRSWLNRDTSRSLRPMRTMGRMTSGMPSSRPAVSLGARVKR